MPHNLNTFFVDKCFVYNERLSTPNIRYVRPVRRIGNEIRSGPVRSAVSDRSRTDLGPDRFDDFFRRRENFDDAKSFEKQVRNGAIDFVQESSTSELSS